jgi:hypothetical protein
LVAWKQLHAQAKEAVKKSKNAAAAKICKTEPWFYLKKMKF